MPLKLFHASVGNSDIGTQTSLHTLFTYLGQILAKFEPNRRSKIYKILSFLTKHQVF